MKPDEIAKLTKFFRSKFPQSPISVRKRPQKDSPPAAPPGAEDMVRCARCGVHLPRGEAVISQQRFFCSSQHEREFDSAR